MKKLILAPAAAVAIGLAGCASYHYQPATQTAAPPITTTTTKTSTTPKSTAPDLASATPTSPWCMGEDATGCEYPLRNNPACRAGYSETIGGATGPMCFQNGPTIETPAEKAAQQCISSGGTYSQADNDGAGGCEYQYSNGTSNFTVVSPPGAIKTGSGLVACGRRPNGTMLYAEGWNWSNGTETNQC